MLYCTALFWITPDKGKLLCLICCSVFGYWLQLHDLFKLSTVSLLLALVFCRVKYGVLWETLNSDVMKKIWTRHFLPNLPCIFYHFLSPLCVHWLSCVCYCVNYWKSYFEWVKWALQRHFQDVSVVRAHSHSWVNIFPLQIYTAVVCHDTLCLDRQGDVRWRDISSTSRCN